MQTSFNLIVLIIAVLFSTHTKAQEKQRRIRATHVVEFDIKIGGSNAGTITLGLFGDVAPNTVKNFLSLASEKGVNGYRYKNSKFHRVIKDFMIQGGDVVNGDGTGSISIYGQQFPDEKFELRHTEAGMLSMANSGPNTNGCQWFITVKPTPWLDGKHVVFGKVFKGMDVVDKIVATETGPNDKPLLDVVISDVRSFV